MKAALGRRMRSLPLRALTVPTTILLAIAACSAPRSDDDSAEHGASGEAALAASSNLRTVVAMFNSRTFRTCTAVKVGSRLLMTSASCIGEQGRYAVGDALKLRSFDAPGGTGIGAPAGLLRNVQAVSVHPRRARVDAERYAVPSCITSSIDGFAYRQGGSPCKLADAVDAPDVALVAVDADLTGIPEAAIEIAPSATNASVTAASFASSINRPHLAVGNAVLGYGTTKTIAIGALVFTDGFAAGDPAIARYEESFRVIPADGAWRDANPSAPASATPGTAVLHGGAPIFASASRNVIGVTAHVVARETSAGGPENFAYLASRLDGGAKWGVASWLAANGATMSGTCTAATCVAVSDGANANGPSPLEGAGPYGCTEVTTLDGIWERKIHSFPGADYTLLGGRVVPNLTGETVQQITVVDGKTIGTFDLAAEPASTCTHCVSVANLWQSRVFGQISGTMTITKVQPHVEGTLSNVKLIEFDNPIAPGASSASFVDPKPGGACLFIRSLAFTARADGHLAQGSADFHVD